MRDVDRLHVGVLKWLHKRGWRSLRDIQELAIAPILGGDCDVLIAAPTAGGKTEAAFLPIVSSLATTPSSGVGCLCISPLRALINDQARRLESLCESAGLRVQPWHGDITAGRSKFWKEPAEVLLITPESLEAMMMRRPGDLARVLAELRYVVVDELHALLGTVRGRQMQSLLHRVDTLLGRTSPRIALSATFGDMAIAERFLRHDGALPCRSLIGEQGGTELRMQVRAQVRKREGAPDPYDTIADQLFSVLRGESHLVFANSRGLVEQVADSLRELSERAHVENEFHPHHGSLSRDQRLWLEERLRDGKLPTTAICTSTLELGVDLGDVTSVVQIGPPPSVSALKQRLGRSGRRPGNPQILRQYVVVPEVDSDGAPAERLRLPLLQSIAAIELMLQKRFESPSLDDDLHYSTLVQQTVSVITQNYGAKADQLYGLLCATGPFKGIDPSSFRAFLHGLGKREVLEQLDDGTLVPGPTGEHLLAGYDIYMAFAVPEEMRLITQGRLLGTLPIDSPVAPGMHIVFAGRRWRIEEIEQDGRTLILVPAPAGKVPKFGGSPTNASALIRRGMLGLLRSTELPVYLDAEAQEQLLAARREFAMMGLDSSVFYEEAAQTWFAPWCSDRALNTLQLALSTLNLDSTREDAFLTTGIGERELASALAQLVTALPSVDELLLKATPVREQKFDDVVDETLLLRAFGVRHLDREEAKAVLREINQMGPSPA